MQAQFDFLTSEAHPPNPVSPPENAHTQTSPNPPHQSTAPCKSALEAYLKKISTYPALDKDDEHDLARIIKEGTQEEADLAREIFLESNLKLVTYLAQPWIKHGCPLEDLLAEGAIGLQTAIDRFDPTQGSRFSTYAAWWIKNSFRKATNDSKLIKIPLTQRPNIRTIHSAVRELTELTGTEPTNAEIAQHLDKTEYQIEHLRGVSIPLYSIHHTRNDESGNQIADTSWETQIASTAPQTHTPFQELENKNTAETLLELIKTKLTEQEQSIIIQRFGLQDENPEPLTLDTIAKQYGLTRERIRQKETQALQKLKHSLRRESHLAPILASLKQQRPDA
jgi:RNA polymerase sigma factor (sigma-70 family)